jgi:hypothetical protein
MAAPFDDRALARAHVASNEPRPGAARRLRVGPPRVVAAVALGIGFLAVACGAADVNGPPIGTTPPGEALRETPPKPAPLEDAGNCPYGRLEDPHRGFVRCLEPGEADAGGLPPAPQLPSEDAGAPAEDAGPAAPEPDAGPPAPPAPPPDVELGEPKFENGEVPKAQKFLESSSDKIAKCVADHGGVTGSSGKVKLQFLVRARGRAEGVEILSAKGVSDEATQCIRVYLKNRVVGPPTADPVGVTVTVTLKPK